MRKLFNVGKKRHGSGCGSVGRAAASDTRGPRFESSHQQNLFISIEHFVYYPLCIGKTKIKKKRPGMALFLTIIIAGLTAMVKCQETFKAEI